MFIKTIDFVDPDWGMATEKEVIWDTEDEAKDLIFDIVEETYELPDTFFALDEASGEMVEFEVKNYLTNLEIDFINAILQYDEINLSSMIGALNEIRTTY